MKNENGKGESAVRKVLNNEIVQLLSIVGVVYSFVALVILPLNRLVDKVDVIEKNHLVHIQKSIEDMKVRDERQNETIVEILKNIERLNVSLESNLKK